MTFRNVALAGFPFYWTASQFHGPQVSTLLWIEALGIESVPWNDKGTANIDGFDHIDLFLVNIWADAPSLSLLKARYPNAKYAALIDMPLEPAINGKHRGYFAEMEQADAIIALTPAIGSFLSTLLNKPAYTLRIPVAPTERWLPYRDMEREDYILALDHSYYPTPAPTIAALAAIQRTTGLPVKFGASLKPEGVREEIRYYVELAGLQVEFLPGKSFESFAQVTARARLCVDLVAHHTTGRHELFSAMIGTPCIGSRYTADTGQPQIEPYAIDDAMSEAESILGDVDYYESIRRAGYRETEKHHGYEAVYAQMQHIAEMLM